jgi:hypothetical protein
MTLFTDEELGLEPEPKEKTWRHVPSFLDAEEADTLYARLVAMTFTPHPTDGPGAFYKTLGDSYTGRGTQFEPIESNPIPEGWRRLADRISKQSQSPVNYIQIHRFAPTVPVRPHFDPGGMIVPMLTVGQERTFRVGGKFTNKRCYPGSPDFLPQIERGLELHEPEEKVLMRHGDLLVFIGGNVIHSMFPSTEDSQFNSNGRDWRFSIIFRWTTDAMRKYGPGKKALAAGHREQYQLALERFQEAGR